MDWTEANIKRAAEEGWKQRGGYVTRVYDENGTCRFSNTFDIVYFLREQGLRSEWHRDVYVSIPWTAVDDVMAHQESWRLSFRPPSLVSTTNLLSGEALRIYVLTRAEAGDPLHIKALSTLTKFRLLSG